MSSYSYSASRSSFSSSNNRYHPYTRDRNKSSEPSDPKNDFTIFIDSVEWEPFKKDFYVESANTAAMPQESIDEWKKLHAIECFNGYQEYLADNPHKNWNKSWVENEDKTKEEKKAITIPKPIMTFENCLQFSENIQSAINRAGFITPTPIQSISWPILLSGYNAIGVARTGSGKTLAFLLPAIVHILAQPAIASDEGPIALVIAPTRELACQIEGEVAKFACDSVTHCCVYGGASKTIQSRKLRTGVSIVIATPGRLLDFCETEVTNLRRVTYCVIDEADRLLDMGFKPQLNAILGQIRKDRQIMMFSATWPLSVRSLAKEYMLENGGDDRDIFQMSIGAMDKLVANTDVTQKIIFCGRSEKIKKLKELIKSEMYSNKDAKILVFVGTKKFCTKMEGILWKAGHWVCCIHGNKQQSQRDRALADFKSGKMRIMLATDVASRGLQIDNITLVINFDFPQMIEDYVHRIGRTGRAGNKGNAITLFACETDGIFAKDLIRVLRDAKQEIPDKLNTFKSYKKNPRTQVSKAEKQWKNSWGMSAEFERK